MTELEDEDIKTAPIMMSANVKGREPIVYWTSQNRTEGHTVPDKRKMIAECML